jgi:hypothetical protein
MAKMLVMRHANGDLFTEAIGGQPRIPVWSSRAAVSRYRERYPELLTCLRHWTRKARGFLSHVSRRAGRLSQPGRPISLDERLLTSNLASPPATVRIE